MIFDTPIVLYIVISFALVAILLALLTLLKNQSSKDIWLKVFASLTFLVHISSVWYDYFTKGFALVGSTILFPVFFCNLNMWILVIVAFMNKKCKWFQILSEYLLYAGTFGAIIATLFSEFYNANPDLSNFVVFKSLLSHTFLLAGCLWLGVGGYVRIRVRNTFSFVTGVMICVYDGFILNLLFKIIGRTDVNAMYLNQGPLSSQPWLTSYFIITLLGVFVFLFTAIYEQIALKKEDRWYTKIRNYFTGRNKDAH